MSTTIRSWVLSWYDAVSLSKRLMFGVFDDATVTMVLMLTPRMEE